MIDFEKALEIVLGSAAPLPVEEAAADQALGRALAEAVDSPCDVPPAANSAMDGICVRAADVANARGDAPCALRVQGTIAAGDPADEALREGWTFKIMTGAPIPPGADAVIPVEVLRFEGDQVFVSSPVKSGAEIRPAGADVRAGQRVFDAGTSITSAHIGVFASIGRTTVPVRRRARVAVMATGSELVNADEEAPAGKIRNSNGPALCAAIRKAGADAIDFGIIRDDRASIESALAAAMKRADAIVSSGGVSVGEFDFVKEALAKSGVDILFEKVAQKPGKPMAFGRRGPIAFFGLPGNPAASLVCFEIYVRAYLRTIMGHAAAHRPHAYGRFAETVRKKPGRAHFVRVLVEPSPEGYTLRPAGDQGSGLLRPMALGRHLALLPKDADSVGPETPVKFFFLDAEA
ncbi:MAG: molybdopterin molybdotransferase MoeA [Deltaproteobacteria bacterium]|nr:molybdopterin molybdotransferase MoeA [Deltaproteobacteria bacterium]